MARNRTHIHVRTIARVLLETDVLKLISRYVPLTMLRGQHWGACPFHFDKQRSFRVSPAIDRKPGFGGFKCFGCGRGGNAVDFVKAHLSDMDFDDAVVTLASEANIPVEFEGDLCG